ncbi:MAG: cation transporter dimerization domain-containing protein, partial [Geminicoccaceae bacterium]
GLAGRAVGVLLDRAPQDLGERMTRAVLAVPGVVQADRVRLRESGNRLFADVVVTAPRTASLAEAHDLSDRVEAAVRAVEPRTETLVHVEPIRTETETAAQRIRAVSLRLGINTHHEQVYRADGRLEASLHVEVEPELRLREAHAVADRLVAAIRQDNPALTNVDTHIEPAAPVPVPRHRIESGTEHRVKQIIRLVTKLGLGAKCHEARLYRTDTTGWGAVLHCDFDPDLPMREIHRRTEEIEYALRQHFPDLQYALIQAEPAAMPARD